jgi:hypothetical protein
MISIQLIEALLPHARSNNSLLLYAPLDVILADTSIVQPDIVYLTADRKERVSRRGIEGTPAEGGRHGARRTAAVPGSRAHPRDAVALSRPHAATRRCSRRRATRDIE